ncbi:hypothetical protein EGK75_07450 [Neisseria weixii]|uniref:Uncharacterized protein n=2 Tax=Neisseria weixii TaxID=1853276 RepID=A0A3N4MQW7_9NEIS|nr:hypothetical protein EGK74_08165 [Neisseria weixii]RPD87194.1 hypothetical protein EGK75_07450 [Neisseria weixii]
MDWEFAFKTLWGIGTAAFWLWVNTLSGRLKEAEKERAALQREIHDVKLAYSTKQEAAANQQNVMAGLNRLEAKIDKLDEKIDRKADK